MIADAVLIAGPTASGKSSLAAAIAMTGNGRIINADSMQVYRELRVLTARPDRKDLAAIPHDLFGHVSAAENYSVGRWLEEARNAAQAAWQAGLMPIFVGGTGLYFRALLEGLAQVPPVEPSIVVRWRNRLASDGPELLHAILTERDPQIAARLPVTDGQRIVRALAVLEGTGKSLRSWQRDADAPGVLTGRRLLKRVLAPDRAWLHARIEQRFDTMLEAGGWEEARQLADLELDPELPAMKAIGVRELIAAVSGLADQDSAIAAAKTATRRYAKRQETWFRHQMEDWPRLAVPLEDESLRRLLAVAEIPLDPGVRRD